MSAHMKKWLLANHSKLSGHVALEVHEIDELVDCLVAELPRNPFNETDFTQTEWLVPDILSTANVLKKVREDMEADLLMSNESRRGAVFTCNYVISVTSTISRGLPWWNRLFRSAGAVACNRIHDQITQIISNELMLEGALNTDAVAQNNFLEKFPSCILKRLRRLAWTNTLIGD